MDHGVLPLGVIRGGKIVIANDHLAKYLGMSREELLETSFLEHVAPADRTRVSERHERRVRGETVPDAYELELIGKDGKSRHAEVYVAFDRDSGDTTFELADRTQSVARRMRLRELAGLGAAVQREHTEDRIFETLGRGLIELGIGWARVEPDDNGLRVLDAGAPNDSIERLESAIQSSVRGALGPWSDRAHIAWREGSAFVDDLPLDAREFFGASAAGDVARDTAMGRSIALRVDVQQRPWQLLFVMADWLLEEDLTSFGLLRIQVSAALDAARVIADLSARNLELAALNSIGAAAGAGIATNALFEILAKRMTALLGQKWLSIYLFDEPSGDAILTFQLGFPPGVEKVFGRISATTILGGVARSAKPVVWRWSDMSADTHARLETLGMPFALVSSVPLVAGARVIGAMNAGYDREEEMLTSHLEVLQAAGAHFAAALQAKGLLDDLRKSYGDLARTQEQLVQRERLAALGELAAIVAHEIRNPLGAVFNAIGALRHQAEATKGSRLATLLAILEEEATRMNDIVGDLLDFARPVSAALRPEHIESIVTEALDAATHDAAGPVKVERDVDPSLPAVPVDGRLLRQAILNVALNAVQALGARGGTLTLRMKNDRAKNGEGVLIEITDTGPGIPSEHQSRVFEPFFTTRASGTGLGLTVVKRIVDVHHGETTLQTEPGKGTTFAIRLPVVS